MGKAHMTAHLEKWTKYRDQRLGTYEFRCRTRYGGVLERLRKMGLQPFDSVMDLGAGTYQFGRFLRESGYRGLYIPVDPVLDGVDLETFQFPYMAAAFVVAIEVAEHLEAPLSFLGRIEYAAAKGAVITTPNPSVVDVRRCDETHLSELTAHDLLRNGWNVTEHSWFHEQDHAGQLDTLLAWKKS
jgi:hypothetical protein